VERLKSIAMAPDVPILKVEASELVPDGTQVWLDGQDHVVDVTTDSRAKFLSMFGLMQVPPIKADKVLISTSDYEAMVQSAKDRAAP
jgi:hypothetical protein